MDNAEAVEIIRVFIEDSWDWSEKFERDRHLAYEALERLEEELGRP